MPDCVAERDEFEPSVPIVQSLDEQSNPPGYRAICRVARR
jgi:hypothetical protein